MTYERIEVANDLGENILWDDINQCLWWTDITQLKLYKLDWLSRDLNVYTTPYKLCSFGFVEGQAQKIIAAFEHKISIYDPVSGDIEDIFHLDTAIKELRFNDGRVDAMGRFWVGTMSESAPPQSIAKLYCIKRNETSYVISQHLDNLQISNGICWDISNEKMYLADSAKQQIFQFRYDLSTGQISHQQLILQTQNGHYPDGAIVDTNNQLWSAQWGGGCITVLSHDNKLIDTFQLPVSQPTCVCFGGADMSALFASSARFGLSQNELRQFPFSGDVFVIKTKSKGLPANRFKRT